MIDRVRLSQLAAGLDNLRAGDSSLEQIRSPRFVTCLSAAEAYTASSTAGKLPKRGHRPLPEIIGLHLPQADFSNFGT